MKYLKIIDFLGSLGKINPGDRGGQPYLGIRFRKTTLTVGQKGEKLAGGEKGGFRLLNTCEYMQEAKVPP